MECDNELIEAMEHLSTMVRDVLDDNPEWGWKEGGVEMPDWIAQGYQACDVVDDHVRYHYDMNIDVPDECYTDES